MWGPQFGSKYIINPISENENVTVTFILPRVCRSFSTCTLHSLVQCTTQSPGETPACKISLCQIKINAQGQLSLQSKFFVTTATNSSSIQTIRILSSIPGLFFNHRPSGPQPNSLRMSPQECHSNVTPWYHHLSCVTWIYLCPWQGQPPHGAPSPKGKDKGNGKRTAAAIQGGKLILLNMISEYMITE